MGHTSRRYSLYKIAGRKVTNALKRPGVAEDGKAPIWNDTLKKYEPGDTGGGTNVSKHQIIDYVVPNTGVFEVSNGVISELILVEALGDIQREGIDFVRTGNEIDFGEELPGPGTIQIFYFEALSVVKPDYTATYKTVATPAYTLLEGDLGKILLFTNVGAITITIPSGLSNGFQCLIRRRVGSGNITYQDDGTSVIESEGLIQASENTTVHVDHMGSNVFSLSGKLT